jgi:hypothetical protein
MRLALTLSDCHSVTGSPLITDFVIAPDTCFAFRNATFEDAVSVMISLALVNSNTFFGTDITARIFITHDPLPSNLNFDSDEFKKPIPIFCNPRVDTNYSGNVEVPHNLTTKDGKGVTFELSFVQSINFDTEHFGANGNCLMLTCDIPQLDASGQVCNHILSSSLSKRPRSEEFQTELSL